MAKDINGKILKVGDRVIIHAPEGRMICPAIEVKLNPDTGKYKDIGKIDITAGLVGVVAAIQDHYMECNVRFPNIINPVGIPWEYLERKNKTIEDKPYKIKHDIVKQIAKRQGFLDDNV